VAVPKYVTARQAALLTHVRVAYVRSVAGRLRSLSDEDLDPHTPAWAARTRAPNVTPWAHLSNLIESL
jgi:hypothetical protein